MMRNLVVFSFLILFFSGCDGCKTKTDDSKVELEANDSLKFELIELKKVHDGCNDSICTYAIIKYPKFVSGANNEVLSIINNNIIDSLSYSIILNNKPNSLQEVIDQFIASYIDVIKDFEETDKEDATFINVWEMERKVTVDYNKQGLLCLNLIDYEFTGGAHGLTTFNFMNFSTKNGGLLSVKSVFKADALKEMNKLADDKFRMANGLEPSQSYIENGFFIKTQTLELNNNFAISDTGITFVFNPYEIAPYSEGHILIHFSFDEVENFIQDNTEIKNLIKKII